MRHGPLGSSESAGRETLSLAPSLLYVQQFFRKGCIGESRSWQSSDRRTELNGGLATNCRTFGPKNRTLRVRAIAATRDGNPQRARPRCSAQENCLEIRRRRLTPNVLLIRENFEHSIGSLPLGFTFMVDEGKVAFTRGGLGSSPWIHSFSAGLTLRAGGFPQVYLLFSWGGKEGTHTIANVNNSLLGGSARPSLF